MAKTVRVRLVQVRRIEPVWLLAPVAVGKNHHILIGYFPRRTAIPPAVNDPRSAEYPIGVPVSVIAKSNVMDCPGRHRLSSRRRDLPFQDINQSFDLVHRGLSCFTHFLWPCG